MRQTIRVVIRLRYLARNYHTVQVACLLRNLAQDLETARQDVHTLNIGKRTPDGHLYFTALTIE